MKIPYINYNYTYQRKPINQAKNEASLNKSSIIADIQYLNTNKNYIQSYYPNFTANFPKTLYRAIYKPEYENLMEYGYSKGDKFCSLNPKGWAGSQWENGFGYGNKNIYFVTYKKNIFPVSKIVQLDAPHHDSNSIHNWDDVRFFIKDGYSLDNIESIRKGNNVCGKIVWAQEKSIITEDKLKQKQRITELINKVIGEKEPQYSDDFDELCHWCRRFHDIPQKVIDRTNNEFSQSLIFYMIEKTKDKKYLPYIEDRILNNDKITPDVIRYLRDIGRSDLLTRQK